MTDQKQSIYRALDANLNRAQEALRVVEDVLRFVVQDPYLTSVSKRLRHDLADWSKQDKRSRWTMMRNAAGDVGRGESTASEYQRDSVVDLLQANLSRAEQALRCLEEFAKFKSPTATESTADNGTGAAQAVEKIRYRVYDLETAISSLLDSQRRMAGVHLYVLAEVGDQAASDFRTYLRMLCDSGVDAIQLREKSLDDRRLIEFGHVLVEVCREHSVMSLINDRVDIAVAVQADGVHLGQEDLPVESARQILGPDKLIGLSTHSIQQARDAALTTANYIGVGPTFPSDTKAFEKFTGTDLLKQVVAEIVLPAFAIGGIDLQNLPQVQECGISRVAVSAVARGEADQVQKSLREMQLMLAEFQSDHAR